MANTYVALAKSVLTSTTASVTFSAISGTYTDLLLKLSNRGGSADDQIAMVFNGDDAGTTYRFTRLIATGTTPSTSNTTLNNRFLLYGAENNSGYTANTFTNTEIYISNYATTGYKIISYSGGSENNSATAYNIGNVAGMWSSSSAVTTIRLDSLSSNFVSGSSFYLYGIKSS